MQSIRNNCEYPDCDSFRGSIRIKSTTNAAVVAQQAKTTPLQIETDGKSFRTESPGFMSSVPGKGVCSE